ncbi:expressed unknown protein [Seminavis robusta]|uniref:C2HC zinc finger plants domain-containing protein n=1 Tax=Seminavis robusta TaxID=568900 RepID=A0A9N8DDT6_9STRA|nr:expressed unknown protein [Seminavis robusta]|eukprot:Sro96_g049550.1 n/a (177) ;mRNA; f:47320-47850
MGWSTTSGSSSSSMQQGITSRRRSQDGQIEDLIAYARSNYQENPTECLAALLEAMTLNSGHNGTANATMDRLRNELGDDVANAVGSQSERTQRARRMVQALLEDSSTFLYGQGRQHILQQTMEDGSSVVCSKCHAVVASTRWRQHQQYWCETIQDDGDDDQEDQHETSSSNIMDTT